MGCCKYCTYGSNSGGTSSGSNSGSSSSNIDTSDFVTKPVYEDDKFSILREIAHLKADRIALAELVEELQTRCKELQDCMQETQDSIKELQTYAATLRNDVVELRTIVTNLGTYVSNAYVTVDGSRRYLSSTSGSISSPVQSLPISAFTKLITKSYIARFTPYEIYRRYLVGDYENDPTNRGFQTNAEIRNLVNVLPTAMRTPIDYLPIPAESDRPEDRIVVRDLFLNLEGFAAGIAELNNMLNGGDAAMQTYARQVLQKLYYENVSGDKEA